MKRTLACLFVLAVAMAAPALCQTPLTTITLFSPNKYHFAKPATFNFGPVPPGNMWGWEVGYGFLWVNDELDWFQVPVRMDSQTFMQDLGKHTWNDQIKVPVVAPLSRKNRKVVVVSGAAKKEGGLAGDPYYSAANPGPAVSFNPPDIPSTSEGPTSIPDRGVSGSSKDVVRRQEQTIKVSPVLVKALARHMYVVHVVDDESDFYALFRIDKLQSGDNCTISWKRIPSPTGKSK
jgi:hypothetical protein